MKVNKAGLKIIKDSEGLRLKAYKCPANVWTIGYGRTKGVKRGMTITKKQAEEFLLKDVEWAENSVSKYVKVKLNENQFSALVSFVFNVGSGNFRRSTLLRKLNKKDYAGASIEFRRWNRGGGRVLRGLVIRRAKEKELFLKPVRVKSIKASNCKECKTMAKLERIKKIVSS